MLASCVSVVALAIKIVKPETKTVTRIVSMTETKVIKQLIQQTSKSFQNDAVRTAIKPIPAQKTLPKKRTS